MAQIKLKKTDKGIEYITLIGSVDRNGGLTKKTTRNGKEIMIFKGVRLILPASFFKESKNHKGIYYASFNANQLKSFVLFDKDKNDLTPEQENQAEALPEPTEATEEVKR